MAEPLWLALSLHYSHTHLQVIYILDLPEILHILNTFKTMSENAERINGLAAMIGIVAAIGAYAVTGQIIPGIW